MSVLELKLPPVAATLVVGGVFRHSRNPMYLALLLALIGWGLFLSNAFALLAALGFVPYMNRFQIEPEERVLARAYDAEFAAYCRQVRRWL